MNNVNSDVYQQMTKAAAYALEVDLYYTNTDYNYILYTDICS